MPNGSRRISLLPPLLGRVDVHAPQLPVVAVAGVLVALHLKCIVLDVIDGGKNNPLVVLFYSGQDWLGPVNTQTVANLLKSTPSSAITQILSSCSYFIMDSV